MEKKLNENTICVVIFSGSCMVIFQAATLGGEGELRRHI